jgi:hypothetical protein
MATSRESWLASIPEEADNSIKVSRAEFWKLVQHEDEDYTDPDFAGEIDWPSTKVEQPVPARLGPGLDCHYSIESTPIRFQQSKLNLGHNSSGHSNERIFAETSPKDHLKQRRSRAIRLEDEEEDDPTDEDVLQFHRHFEDNETNQYDPEGKSASPQPGQCETDRSESPFGSCYNRPLTGNEFYDRRPPPGFNLLHSVQQSIAAYNKSFGISQSTARTASPLKRGPTLSSFASLPSVDSSPSKSAPTHRPAANHQGQTTTSKSASRTTGTDERTQRNSEHARAGIAYSKGRVASQIRTGDAKDVSTRKTLNTNGIESHRQFKPTVKKPRRRR